METIMHSAFLSLLVVLAWSSSAHADHAKKKPSRFEEMVETVGGGGAMQLIAYGYVPPLSAWATLKVPGLPPLKDFPEALLKALDSMGTGDHEVALRFVQSYAAATRKCAV